MMWVPDDHTGGPPFPVAQVADNDLAVGRIVDTITHSRFWRNSAIFVLEDDPQNGVDHVDGHRSVLWVASPWSRPGVNDTYYSQINVVRTVEQILGIHAMNQEDLAAQPMYSAFQSRPNFAPFTVLPNQIPLTLGVPGYSSTLGATAAAAAATAQTARGATALARTSAAAVPASERAVHAAWVAWSTHQHFVGRHAIEDWAKPALLNRLDWYSSHNWRLAYPGDPGSTPLTRCLDATCRPATSATGDHETLTRGIRWATAAPSGAAVVVAWPEAPAALRSVTADHGDLGHVRRGRDNGVRPGRRDRSRLPGRGGPVAPGWGVTASWRPRSRPA